MTVNTFRIVSALRLGIGGALLRTSGAIGVAAATASADPRALR
jgi:hypothetical protein